MTDEPTAQQDNGGADPQTPTAPPEKPPTEATPPDPSAWRNVLPKEYRDDPNFTKYKGVGDWAKSHLSLVRLLGAEPRVPAKDAPPDQWNQFYSALGRPDTPDKYVLPIPEGEGAPQVVPELVEGFKQVAHAAGLSASQAAKVAEWYFEAAAKAEDTRAAEIAALTETTTRELRRELGTAYDSKVLAATRLFAEFGGDAFMDWLEASGAGSNAALIRFGVKLADALSEDRLGSARPASLGHTPDEAQREIARLDLDKEFQKALWDAQHPGHKEAVRRRSELFAAAYPTEEVPA